jgi:hypothetical protein
MQTISRVDVPGGNTSALTLGFLNSTLLTADSSAALALAASKNGDLTGIVGAAPGFYVNPVTPVPSESPSKKLSAAVIAGAVVGGIVVLVIIVFVVKKVTSPTLGTSEDYIAMNSVSVNNYEHV